MISYFLNRHRFLYTARELLEPRRLDQVRIQKLRRRIWRLPWRPPGRTCAEHQVELKVTSCKNPRGRTGSIVRECTTSRRRRMAND
jgi:hypothetical protein